MAKFRTEDTFFHQGFYALEQWQRISGTRKCW